MADATDYRTMRIPLRHGSGAMPAAGFGTLIADPGLMRTATRAALDAGYRHLDCAERYRNEPDIGDVLQAYYAASGLSRQNIFITTKLWNTNHRPERVEAAFERSRERLKLDVLDLYLIHTPFAFEPGDNFDPRSESGDIVYGHGVTLQETWGAMEDLVRRGRTRAIGISDVGLEELGPLYERASIKPAVIQVEVHPYLPQTELLTYCRERRMVVLAFAPLGHGIRPGPIDDPVVLSVAKRLVRSPAQVLLAWAVQRGTAILTTPKSAERARENFDIAPLPDDAFEQVISDQDPPKVQHGSRDGRAGFHPAWALVAANSAQTGEVAGPGPSGMFYRTGDHHENHPRWRQRDYWQGGRQGAEREPRQARDRPR
jgi:alcohol dehydrogenase (NADP+)